MCSYGCWWMNEEMDWQVVWVLFKCLHCLQSSFLAALYFSKPVSGCARDGERWPRCVGCVPQSTPSEQRVCTRPVGASRRVTRPPCAGWELSELRWQLPRAAEASEDRVAEQQINDYSCLKFNYILKQQLNFLTSTKCFAWLKTVSQKINSHILAGIWVIITLGPNT